MPVDNSKKQKTVSPEAHTKRRGRKVVPAIPGERCAMSLRVTAEMKEELEAAAVKSGRSLSQEAELRLALSFKNDWLLKALRKGLREEAIKLAALGVEEFLRKDTKQ